METENRMEGWENEEREEKLWESEEMRLERKWRDETWVTISVKVTMSQIVNQRVSVEE